MPDELDLPDSLFIPSDDVSQEAGDVPTEEAAAAPEPESAQIPESRIQEIIRDRDLSRQEAAQLRALVFKLGERLEEIDKKATPALTPEFDPDVEALIGPIIEARMEKRLAALMPTVHNLQAKNETQEAWNYLNSMVHDLEELGPDIVAYIQTLPTQRAAKILSDPDDIADIAERIRLKKQLQAVGGVGVANRDMRSRGRGETPSGTRQASSSKDPFAELLHDDAKFDAYMRKSGLL